MVFAAYDRSLKRLAQAPVGRGARGNRLSVVYFSCHRDFGMLQLSLRSLLKYGASRIHRIYIYEDAKNRFTSAEKDALSATSGMVSVITGPRVSGWGAKTLIRELNFFRRTLDDASDTRPRGMLKLDSDVLFLNGSIFAEIDRCGSDLFGNPYSSACGFTYSQGGCYFITADFLRVIVSSGVTQAMRELSALINMPVNHLPEDASIFYLAQCHGARVEFSQYYLPHQQIPTFVPSPDERASVIHFESGLGPHLRQHMQRIGQHLMAA